MNLELLQSIGLTKSQANTYLVLIQKGELAPPQLAKLNGETRSNTYMILQKLEELGLVEKQKKAKKIIYCPQNPIALEHLAEEKRSNAAKVENQLKQAMPQVLSYFYSFTEKPGIRLLQGAEGLKEIYKDTLRTRQDIYFMRTPSEVKHLGSNYFVQYRKKRAALGITAYAFTENTPSARRHALDDQTNKIVRTMIEPGDYNAPVEVTIYGDKVAYLSYGEEIMGVIVQSASIAESMRQIFRMVGKTRKT